MLVLYGHIQPYKTCLTNALEIILDLTYVLILLIISSQIFEQYNSSGCSSAPGVATVTWILTPVYYFPLLVLAIVGVSLLLKSVFRFVYSCVKQVRVLIIAIDRDYPLRRREFPWKERYIRGSMS